jgi:ribonuclease HII
MVGAACTMLDRPSLRFERRFWRAGCDRVAGLDEAGRGSLAGPVCVGAVVLPSDPTSAASGTRRLRRLLHGVRDSKQMRAAAREMASARVQEAASSWGLGLASSEEIDSLGIVAAVRLAALRALETMPIFPQALLTDFRLELPELDVPQTSLVRGDSLCMSIAAASVLAKTARDALMREMDLQIPGYGLAQHKGYGTARHRRAIERLGLSAVHRQTFSVAS